MITAPFNFVPLSKEVFFPDWAEDISHDAPFKDSQSGVIDITLTAKSPIFVRDSVDENMFCSHNGDYYIPSTSVKGMVRNILEIMSFSKMSQVDDDTYAVRDLRNRELYMSKMTPDKILSGWLKKTQDGYVIEDCGRAGRIKHEEIDKIFNIDFASKFRKGAFSNKADDKTALKKYGMLQSSNLTHTFTHTTLSTVGDKRYVYDKSSSLEATLVLTGQPSARDETKKIPSGKVYEFLFFESRKDIKLSKEAMDNFLFSYFDGRDTEPKESPDWTYWKEKLENGEKVPVFFQKDGSNVAHFGLSYLYKLPYKHSVEFGIPQNHKDTKKLDLAQSIFGYTHDTTSLKGRVQFSHFKSTSKPQVLQERTEILGTPRASYYPIYVRQNEKLFMTFMDDFSIAGWKRYPIHKGNITVKTEKNDNENVGTKFIPLKDGVTFSGKLRYHNLKKAELGAILSALTFHNTKDSYHNIGMAKSLGYGKIKIKLNGVDNFEDYLKSFELEMASNISNWSETDQLKELLSMSLEQNNAGNSKLRYMPLEEFANNKSISKDCLRNYTKLEHIKSCKITSLVSSAELEEAKSLQVKRAETLRLQKEKELEEEKIAQEKLKKEQEFQNKLKLTMNSNNLQIMENFINDHKDTHDIEMVKEKYKDLLQQKESNKHEKVNNEAKKAWDGIHNPKYIKGLQKSLKSFIKKWERNNKGSKFVLELVDKAKQELK